jgi:lipopolysaccharide biosynthesis glycosyltransferase
MSKRETINILFSCDAGYAIPLTVCITSIFENNDNSNIVVYVFYSSLFEDQKEKLHQIAKQYNQKINLIQIEEKYFASVPTLRWTKETYYRLLVTELIPESEERILYLDCDIVINGNIEDFYEMSFDSMCLAALDIRNDVNDEFINRLGLKPDSSYFQAGVILFNLALCREEGLTYGKSLEVINKLGDRILTVDQDVINVMFEGKIKPFDKRFNNYEITNFYGSNWNRIRNYTDKKEIGNTVILHYATGKPWNNLFPGACEDVWFKYLKLSPYKDLWNSRFNTIPARLRRLGLVKVIFAYYILVTPFINSFFAQLLPKSTVQRLKQWYRSHIK